MNIFTFLWKTGTANTNMINTFKKIGIKYNNDEYFNLCADLGDGMKPVEYFNIAGDFFGITYKPRRTVEYFNISADELYKDKGDGWTKEDCILCDHNPDALPWAESLKDAIEKKEYLSKRYPESIFEIVKTISGKYAVVC